MEAKLMHKKQVKQIFILFGLLALVAIGVRSLNKMNLVPLYNSSMSKADYDAVMDCLVQNSLPFEEGRGATKLLVPKEQRIEIQATLINHCLPRDSGLGDGVISTAEDGRTAAEARAVNQRNQEGELTLTFRKVWGVKDAIVKLAMPDKIYWAPPEPIKTARVLLTTEWLPEARLKAMANTVSLTVPDVNAEYVTIVSSTGVQLYPKDDSR